MTRYLQVGIVAMFSVGLLLPGSTAPDVGKGWLSIEWWSPTAYAQDCLMNPTPDCVDQHDMDDDGTPDHLDPCPTDPNDRCDYPGVIEALTNLAISVVRFVGVVIDKVAETLSFGAELIWHFASILFCAIFSSSDICNLEESSVGDEDESG